MIGPLCKIIFSLACLALTVDAQPVERRAGCSNYTIIVTRGTSELRGGSFGFDEANKVILKQHPGGNLYNTDYPASFDQNSTSGTNDIVRKVHELVDQDSGHCVFLEGYSQGAAATVNAMPKITDKYFDAIKHVVMLGNPLHKPGLACNVDNMGGNTTLNAIGISYSGGAGVPESWVSKTTDICKTGDGVCDREHGVGITLQHLSYIGSASVHEMTEKVIGDAL